MTWEFARVGWSVGQLGVSVSWDQTEEEAGCLVIIASTVPTFEDIYSSRELTQGV